MSFWHELPALSRKAAIVGVLALLACLVGAVLEPATFFQSWLVTWFFLLGIALAGMMDVMIHELTGGEWGWVVRPPLEAAMLTLPLLAVLAIPLAFGLPELFPWARADAVAQSPMLEARHWYLNPASFVVRNAVFLIVWSAFALALRRRLERRSEHDTQVGRRIAVAGLLVYLATVTFAAYDWVASLVPEWASTAVGLRLGTAQFVAAFAFAVSFTVFFPRAAGDNTPITPRDCGDLGNLMLTFSMMWAYIAFTQYLIVWGEDLPQETSWFWARINTGWHWIGLAVAVLVFALPTFAMLFRSVKRNARTLGWICALALAGAWLDSMWLVLPSLRARGFELHWLDIAALLAEGGLWLATVAAIAERLPRSRPAPTTQAVPAHG